MSGSGRRTQAERRAESEAKLLDAALRLFARQGYLGTTMEQIGAEAGYSRGLVTQRFGSKIGLAHALIDSIRESFETETVPAMEEVPDRDVLHAWIDRYMRLLQGDLARYPALLALQAESITSLHELRPDLAELNDRIRCYLADRLAAAQSRGEVAPDADLRAIVTATLATLRGTASQWLIDPDRTHLVAVSAALEAMLSEVLFERVELFEAGG